MGGDARAEERYVDRLHLGAFAGSVARANDASAKGGIGSLVRSAATGMGLIERLEQMRQAAAKGEQPNAS